MFAVPIRSVVNASTVHPTSSGIEVSTRIVSEIVFPMFPTRSVARREMVWFPSLRSMVWELLDNDVHVPPSICNSTKSTPLPEPSFAASSIPLTITVVDDCHEAPFPIATVPIVGPLRSIPIKIVSELLNPELSKTVSRGFQVPSENAPVLQSQPYAKEVGPSEAGVPGPGTFCKEARSKSSSEIPYLNSIVPVWLTLNQARSVLLVPVPTSGERAVKAVISGM